ncbi:MAG: polyphenol oxidase family protein, partial [Actinomycetota bacterium]|nr:polyphenol oxidase family protein [Actinomycetota bacterium]
RLAVNRQMHGAWANRARAGGRGEPGDALWTHEAGVPVAALTADCVPIAVARMDGEGAALAVMHAGWRGLLAGIVEAALGTLGNGRVAAALGPAIGACCYEVGPDVAAPLRDRFGSSVLRGTHADLPAAAERALHEAGCPRVERVDLCTACHPELFFSHRRDGGVTGRQGVIGVVA